MTFKERVGQIKDWCNEHKVEIAVATLGAVGSGIVIYGAKKLYGVSKAQVDARVGVDKKAIEDLEYGMFVNGVRKQFLNADNGEEVQIITESLDAFKNLVPDSEENLCGLKHNDKVFVLVQDVAAERGGEVMEAVKNTFQGIDNLEIWVGGTVKE